MDISRLQLGPVPPISRTSPLPLGLQTPVAPDPSPTLTTVMADDANDVAARVFLRFSAAWKQRLAQFIADDPVFRA